MYQLKNELLGKELEVLYTNFINEINLIDAFSNTDGEIYDNIKVEDNCIFFRNVTTGNYWEINSDEIYEVLVYIQEKNFNESDLITNGFTPYTEAPMLAFLLATNMVVVLNGAPNIN